MVAAARTLKSILLIGVLRLLAQLPLGMVRALGATVGYFSWLAGSRMAVTTRQNLAICYPNMSESERLLLGKNSIIETFKTIMESGPSWLWAPEKVLERVVEVEGLALLQDAVAAGNGVVVIAPHFGNWEIFGMYLNNCGCGPSSQLYQAPRDAGLDRLIYQARSRSGAHMVATNNKGVIALLKALKRGEIVGILPDQVPPASGGEFAPFFGKPALTMTLVPRLLHKTGARALTGFAVRTNRGGRAGWKVVFQEAPPGIYAEHMPTGVRALNQAVEGAIAVSPDQYQWNYKRFKRVPPGAERPY